jgi:two-component system, OmpR family, response regulator CpxR
VERILIVDDDIELCELAGRFLSLEGYEVATARDGQTGVTKALSGDFALVILDVMMPGLNGFEVLKRIRAASALPVLMLTARGEDVDRIIGLELGADDYLAKPYNPRELVARIRAILRRVAARQEQTQAAAKTPLLTVADITLEVNARAVTCAGEALNLTTVEFDLLRIFLESAGCVLSRESLYQLVLEREFTPFDRVIDNHVSNLRRKLGPDSTGAERIKTVRNAGYLFALTGKN